MNITPNVTLAMAAAVIMLLLGVIVVQNKAPDTTTVCTTSQDLIPDPVTGEPTYTERCREVPAP